MESGIFTTVASTYADIFAGYFNQFMGWGKMLFGGLLIINMGWLFLWYAFDKESIQQGMSAFLKRFFVVMLFYSIMVNPDWLRSILVSSQAMGILLTGIPIDPSSILDEGIKIANKLILPIEKSSLLSWEGGILLCLIAYVAVLFAFISIALMLSVTLIMATAMISVSCLFLGFAALGATSQIARQSLDVLLGLCVKLLGIYIVVGAGSKTMSIIAKSIPTSLFSLDGYAYIIATVLLFWLIAKNLPEQLAKVVTGAVQETRGTDAAAIAMTAARFASQSTQAMKAAQLVTSASGVPVGIAAAKNAAAHFSTADPGGSVAGKTAGAIMGAAKDTGKASIGTAFDHFKNLASKMSGGRGVPGGVSGVKDRLNQASAALKNKVPIDAPIDAPKRDE